MEKSSYDLLNLIAQCAIAIGTIGATITALYFSRKSTKIKLEVKIEKAIELGFSEEENLEVISINISNLSFRKCIITELYWKLPFHKEFYPEFYNGRNSLRSILPIVLYDGDQFFYNIPLQDFQRKGRVFAMKLKCFPRVLVKLIKFGVYSSTKKEFETRIGKELQKWIISKR